MFFLVFGFVSGFWTFFENLIKFTFIVGNKQQQQ